MTFSFIHAADIHLGRPFSNVSDNGLICKNALANAFNNLIDFALVKNVDFVLIAGDTFDSDEHDFESKLILKEGLKKLDAADIKVILICGNHDPLSSYNKKTFNFSENSNIKIVGLNTNIYEDITVKNKNNESVAVVHALSFKESVFRDNPIQYFTQKQNLFNIGLMHCDLDGSKDSPYAPCTKSDLEALNYDYWALGHIHIPSNYYSGTLQGRNTKETGAHGVKYIKVENGNILKNTFIPLDTLRFEDITSDISNASDTLDAAHIIFQQLEEMLTKDCQMYFIRLNLIGCVNFYNEINNNFFEVLTEQIKNNFENKINISQINNNLTAKINDEALLEDEGIAGTLFKVINNSENIENSFNKIQENLKSLINNCNFSEEEYKQFCLEIKEKAKETSKSLCSHIYNNENGED